MQDNDIISNVLSLKDLALITNSITCGNDLFLADSLGSNVLCDMDIDRFVSATLPFKVDYLQLILCLKGTMKVRLNLKELDVVPHTILIVGPGSLGELLHMSDDFSCVAIGMNLLNHEIKINAMSQETIFKFMISNNILKLLDDEADRLVAIYKLMKDYAPLYETVSGKEMVLKLFETMLLSIIEQMKATMANATPLKVDRRTQLFEQFIREVQLNYNVQRDVSFYAEKLCVSQKYLSHTVRAVTGTKATEWIRRFVILEAKVLLRTQRYTVQQVSDMLNFPNPSFFGVYFKRSVGCTPKDYKNS